MSSSPYACYPHSPPVRRSTDDYYYATPSPYHDPNSDQAQRWPGTYAAWAEPTPGQRRSAQRAPSQRINGHWPQPTSPQGVHDHWSPTPGPSSPPAAPMAKYDHEDQEDEELRRAMEMSAVEHERNESQRQADEEDDMRRIREEQEAEQQRRLDERDREERELAEAFRRSERHRTELAAREADERDELAKALSLSEAAAREHEERRRRKEEQDDADQMAHALALSLEEARSSRDPFAFSRTPGASTSANTLPARPAPPRPSPSDSSRPDQGLRPTPAPREPLSAQPTGDSLPPPYAEQDPSPPSSSADVAAPSPPPPAPAPAVARPTMPTLQVPTLQVPIIMRPLPDLPAPIMGELPPDNRPSFVQANATKPDGSVADDNDDDVRSAVPSMPSLTDDEDGDRRDPFADPPVRGTSAATATTSSVGPSSPACASPSDDEEDEALRSAVERGRTMPLYVVNPDAATSSDSLGFDDVPASSSDLPTPSSSTTPIAPRRPSPTVVARPVGFVLNPTAAQHTLAGISYGFPFGSPPRSASPADVASDLSQKGGFPDTITFSMHDQGRTSALAVEAARRTDGTVFAIEAPTWKRLLDYCMWHANSTLEAGSQDVAEAAADDRELELAVVARFVQHQRSPASVRLFFELVSTDAEPGTRRVAGGHADDGPDARRRTELFAAAPPVTPLNQTVPLPKAAGIRLPLTLGTLGLTLNEIHIAGRKANAPALMGPKRQKPGALLARAIEANARSHAEPKPAAAGASWSSDHLKRWAHRQGHKIVLRPGGANEESRAVDGDGLPVPESFITPYDIMPEPSGVSV